MTNKKQLGAMLLGITLWLLLSVSCYNLASNLSRSWKEKEVADVIIYTGVVSKDFGYVLSTLIRKLQTLQAKLENMQIKADIDGREVVVLPSQTQILAEVENRGNCYVGKIQLVVYKYVWKTNYTHVTILTTSLFFIGTTLIWLGIWLIVKAKEEGETAK